MQTVFVDYGSQRIPVLVTFEERNRLSISVHPDGSVTAKSPIGHSLSQVMAGVERRRSWIARHRRYFEAFQPLPEEKCFVSGETHLYLGRHYRLRVRRSSDVDVKLIGRYLNVAVSTPEKPSSVRLALDRWYRAHAESIYVGRLKGAVEDAPSLRGVNPALRIRPMKRRWGSCSQAGTITLSTELIKTPLHCIEYVIMHELCHLRIHDHSHAFYRLLSRCMPDWERRKERLESVVLR